jgi:hypothetical protein
MDKAELLESIAKIGEVINIQYKIKTQLEEALFTSAINEGSCWINKNNPHMAAVITGIDSTRKEIIVNTTNYRGIRFNYSSFLEAYEIIKV